jgi:prepilin-type N-terminal cleavage/methylation domain-containing protein
VRRARRHAGFTLVEVIVVLVILAILAAIAIPALTGYIDKAQDKQYIAQARNIAVAMRTVINEHYASGEIDRITNSHAYESGFAPGESIGSNITYFATWALSENLYYNDTDALYIQAAALIGETYYGSAGIWWFYFCAEDGSGATAATADAFWCVFSQKGLVIRIFL